MGRMRQLGFSLVEIMISLVLASLLLAGAYHVLSAVLSSSAQALKVSQLNQQMRAILALMSEELQRIGYSANALNHDPVSNPNPFGFTISTAGFNANDCILYSYDFWSADGILNSNENAAFRLGPENAVQWSRSLESPYTSTSVTNCTEWNIFPAVRTRLNNPSMVRISQLTFTAPPAECTNLSTVPRSNCNPCESGYQPWAVGDTLVKIPRIDITLSGHLAADPSVTSTLNTTVRVRNSQIEVATTAGPPPGTGC